MLNPDDLQPLISTPKEDLGVEYKSWLDLTKTKGEPGSQRQQSQLLITAVASSSLALTKWTKTSFLPEGQMISLL